MKKAPRISANQVLGSTLVIRSAAPLNIRIAWMAQAKICAEVMDGSTLAVGNAAPLALASSTCNVAITTWIVAASTVANTLVQASAAGAKVMEPTIAGHGAASNMHMSGRTGRLIGTCLSLHM